jgi:hypothetical protein
MTNTEALITAARQYCQNNYSYWAGKYSHERSGGSFPMYSEAGNDHHLFPRYQVLSAILGEVEALAGRSYADLNDCQEALAAAGLSANNLFTTGKSNETAYKAIQDERNKFIHFIRHIIPSALEMVTPLSYRRRLREDEKKEVRQALLERWNYDGGRWNPLVDKCTSASLFLMKDNITRSDYQEITAFIRLHALANLFEINEEGTDAEIGQSLFDPDCCETVYCDRHFDWIVYGSHEATLAFGGEALISFIKELFKNRQEKINLWEQNW